MVNNDNSTIANVSPTSEGGNQTKSMLDALKSGKTTLSVGSNAPTTELEDNTASSDSQPSAAENDSEDSFGLDHFLGKPDKEAEAGDEEDGESDESELSPEKDSKAKKASDIEELVVTGDKGRRKVKVDFSDREKLKKHVQMAYGARKWQKERDDARSQLQSTQKEYSELKQDWDKIESVYTEKGYKGLIDLLEGRDGAWREMLQQANEEEQRYQDMSPEERRAAEALRKAEMAESKEEKLRQEYEAKLKEINERQEKAELRSTESKVVPAFDRYRFKGKLGDPVAETEFDEMLWNRALTRLEEIPEDIELTQSMVDKEFRRIANAMKKHLNTQVDNKVKRAINRTKQTAAKQAQAKVTKSMRNSAELDEFRKNMKDGNLVTGLKSFFKAGGKM